MRGVSGGTHGWRHGWAGGRGWVPGAGPAASRLCWNPQSFDPPGAGAHGAAATVYTQSEPETWQPSSLPGWTEQGSKAGVLRWRSLPRDLLS